MTQLMTEERAALKVLQPIFSKPFKKKIQGFVPKAPFSIDAGRYLIKTADNYDELEEILKLRFEVFYTERSKKKVFTTVDFDRFDLLCDHLMIIDTQSQRVIGTYRMNSTLFNKDFYSNTEFRLDEVLDLPGRKVELGRACVHKDARGGAAVLLLWKGLARYLTMTDAAYLFGCSSVYQKPGKQMAILYDYLRRHHSREDIDTVCPRSKYINRRLRWNLRQIARRGPCYSDKDVRQMIPPLLGAYLKVSAVVVGEPAWDRKFRCFDFLTLLDVANTPEQVKRRFGFS